MSSAEGSAAVGGAGSPAVASRRDAGALLMPPPAPRAPRRAGPEVLDEDEYVARLDAIITREYFPDVPKLRDTLRWLQATNSGDPARVREAQRAIQRRLDRERGAGDASPSFSLRLGAASDDHTAHTAPTASAATDGWDAEAEDQWREAFPGDGDGGGDARSAPATPSRGLASAAAAAAEDAAAAAVAAADARLGIDGFLRAYTGEDNASFKGILARQNEKTRLRAERVARGHAEAAARAARAGERVSTAEGAGTALSFPVEPVRNDMFFRNGGATALAAENAAGLRNRGTSRGQGQGQGPAAATVARNTRFEDGVVAAAVDAAARSASAAAPRRHAGLTPYSVVATPHIEPGVDATPIVTWGELESTPVRLDGPPAARGGERATEQNDAPPAACAASPFRLRGEDRRERTLRSLVAGTEFDAKGKRREDATRKRGRDGNEGDARRTLSQAARALARRVRNSGEGKTPSRRGGESFEGSLRRAYTPGRTPRRPGSASATPARDHAL